MVVGTVKMPQYHPVAHSYWAIGPVKWVPLSLYMAEGVSQVGIIFSINILVTEAVVVW